MLQRVAGDNGCIYYVSPLLARAGVPHAFSTRFGGVSSPPFDSLNLGDPSGIPHDQQDDPEKISENYRRLHVAIGCESRQRCFVHQVHGGEVAEVAPDGSFANGACADAIVSADPTKLLAVRVADCVPILIASNDGSTVAAVHAGWRGVIAGIIGNAIDALRERGVPASRLVAAIGPCIGFDAFEVGADVLQEFTRLFTDRAPVRADHANTAKGFVDLRAAARLQLQRAGIEDDRIDATDRCTFRHADEFFSHRRDRGITGRMAAVIGSRNGQ